MDVVRQIRATGMRASVAINPGTPSSEISNELGNAVDMILVMTVWPGEFVGSARVGWGSGARATVDGRLHARSEQCSDRTASCGMTPKARSRWTRRAATQLDLPKAEIER